MSNKQKILKPQQKAFESPAFCYVNFFLDLFFLSLLSADDNIEGIDLRRDNFHDVVILVNVNFVDRSLRYSRFLEPSCDVLDSNGRCRLGNWIWCWILSGVIYCLGVGDVVVGLFGLICLLLYMIWIGDIGYFPER